MQILAISGSLRRGSYNAALIRAAAGSVGPGVSLVEWRGVEEVPIYNRDLDTPEPVAEVAELRSSIAAASGLLIATPEYNHSVPGGLKNVLDWASRPLQTNVLRGKPCLVVGASTGIFGAVWAQAEVRKTLKACGAKPLESEVSVGLAEDVFAADGSLADPALAALLEGAVAELARAAKAAVESIPS